MRTLWIAVGAFFAGALALLLVAVGIGWYITDGPGAGPSIDQQQQAWEQDTEREACDAYKRLGGAESFKLGDALDTLAGKEQGETATIQLDLPGCTDSRFGIYLNEVLVRGFPDSPKGKAGETTAPRAPR